MTTQLLVDYDYIADELGLLPETVRQFWLARNADRNKGLTLPARVNPGEHCPLFEKEDADRFIAERRARRETRSHIKGKPRGEYSANRTARKDSIVEIRSDDELVGLEYFADALKIAVRTVRVYGRGGPQGDPSFPEPVTLKKRRGVLLFRKEDADRYVENRLSSNRRGRIRAAAIDESAAAAAKNAAKVLGRPVDLESREDLRAALFTERGLKPLVTSAKSGTPSVSTAALLELHKETNDPFVELVLAYRGVRVSPAE